MEKITRVLEGHDEILFALLFGSRANGRPRPDSDWDVAIYVDDASSKKARHRLRLDIMGELDELGRVDVAVLNDVPPLLAHRALQGRRLLVRDKSQLIRFTLRTLGLADDQRYFSKIHRNAMLRRLEEGRFGRPKRL